MKDNILCSYCYSSAPIVIGKLSEQLEEEGGYAARCKCCGTTTAEYEDPMLALAAWVGKYVT